MQIKTLKEATARFRLRDSSVSNEKLAGQLGLQAGRSDAVGLPNCCLHLGDTLVGIRTREDEVAVFVTFGMIRDRLEKFADQIISPEEEAEATHL